MDVATIAADQLTQTDIEIWLRILEQNPSLDSPYFRPEFVQAVGRARPGSEVGVLSENGEPVAFFPFERRGGRAGKPICGRLSDFQAVVAPPTLKIDPTELVKGCNLNVWDFDHLIVSQSEFAPHREFLDGAPYIDLAEGFEHYQQTRRELGAAELKQTQRKARKMSREVGELRLVDFDPDDSTHAEMFDKTIRWKSDQYRATRITDVLSYKWIESLLRDLLEHRSQAFRGRLTALFAGEHLVSTHLGMESQGVLHYWFPTFNPQFAAYSPGRALLLEICRACEELGVQRIDLGRGMAPFKTRVMTGAVQVAVGSVDLRVWKKALRKTFQSTRDWVKSSPLRYPARAPARVLYQIKEWMEFH